MMTKKLISLALALVMCLSLSFPVFAAGDLGSNANIEKTATAVESLLEEVVWVSNGHTRTATVEESGHTITVVFDDNTGFIYVNGVNIVCDATKQSIQTRSANNWGPVNVYTRSLKVDGLAVGAIGIIITGAMTGAHPTAITVASLAAYVVSNGLQYLYYRSLTQYNYVDFSPKVGYKLTEQIHTSTRYDNTSLWIETKMEGSR